MKKKNKKPFIKFKFNRKDNTHTFKSEGVSGRELILAYQSIGNYIEDKANMPVGMVISLAAEQEKKINKKGN